MRILVCAQEAPLPPLNGLRLQIAEVCEQLTKRHEVCILGYRGPEQFGEGPRGAELITLDPPSTKLPARMRRRLRAVARREPVEVARLGPRMSAAARALVAQRPFDVVQVTSGPIATVGAAVKPLPAVLAALDAWHLNLAADALLAKGPRQWIYRFEEHQVRQFTPAAFRLYKSVVFVTEEDAEASRQLESNVPIAVIPNGVDVDSLAPAPDTRREAGHIVLTGEMKYPPNVQAAQLLAREVLPRVRERRSDARLSLVGRSPHQEVLDLADLDGVEVTGEVPDIRPWLWRAEVYACPMVSGTGIKNKLLEALACACPSVATTLACQGTSVRDREHLLVADDVEAITRAVLELLDQPDRAARLGTAGRAYVVDNHSWASAARAFERLYEEAIEESDAASDASARATPAQSQSRKVGNA
jgi:glycosyltransferase involved in cell wall biosynthesis